MAIDIVDDFLTRLAHHAPGVAPAIAPALEAELRQQWGGSNTRNVYIRKGIGAARKTERLAIALAEGKPLQQAFAESFLSPRSGFRHLAKPFRVKP